MVMPLSRTTFDWLLKIVLLLGLAALAGWFCFKCSGQVPPPPPKTKTVLRSPKDTANQPIRLVMPTFIIVPRSITNTLTWTNPNTDTVGFVIEYRPEISAPWGMIGTVTNATRFIHLTTNPRGYYRVGAFWP